MNDIANFFKDNPIIVKFFLAVGVIILTYIASRFIPAVLQFFRKHITKKTKTELDDTLLKLLNVRLKKIIWVAGIFFFIKVLKTLIHADITKYGNGFLYVITVFIIAGFISSVLTAILDWYTNRWKNQINNQIQNEFTPLFRRLIIIIVYTISIIMILHYFNQNVSSIIVSLGIGSLAIALAAKDTLANMISGFMIMMDRPFRIGDRISLETGEFGDVHDIGLRSTKILTFENTLIIVPNQKIINEKLTNLSYPDPQIRVSVEVGVAYGTDLEKVKKILMNICESHPDVLDDPPPVAYFINFGASSLDFKLLCRVPKWELQWRVAEEIRMEIDRVFKKEGIEIPFPQHVVTITGEKK